MPKIDLITLWLVLGFALFAATAIFPEIAKDMVTFSM